MADPRRIKKVKISATVTTKEEGAVNLYLIVPQENVQTLGEEEIQRQIQEALSKTSFSSGPQINTIQTLFNYQNTDFLKDFTFGNILIDAHLPYCLNFPNEYDMEVSSPDSNDSVLISLRKIWTSKAKDDNRSSDELDFFTDNKIIYFKDGVFLSPKIPVDPSEGWEQNITGKNIQKRKDTSGKFRFTQLTIQLNSSISLKDLEDKENGEKVIKEIQDKALNAVNKLIDSYRFVTREEYVTRLGQLSINMIYFLNHNQGVYLLPVSVETAIMNRPKSEIELVNKMLKENERAQIYELLLLDAQNSFNNKNYTLAIVQSFQALEIFLENFLLKELIKGGKTDKESTDYLAEGWNWKTKTRLRELLKEVKGSSIHDIDQALWMKWCSLYDDTRNEVIHKGKEANEGETKDTLDSNTQIIDLIKKLK